MVIVIVNLNPVFMFIVTISLALDIAGEEFINIKISDGISFFKMSDD